MPPPTVTPTTLDVYDRFPEHYRAADAALPASPVDYALLRFLSLTADQLGTAIDLLARFDDGTGGSDLTDPASADVAWLDWLGQLIGADTSGVTSIAERRAVIAGGPRSATTTSLADAVATVLGDARAVVRRHWNGDPWMIGIVIHPDDYVDDPSDDQVVEANRPAGVDIFAVTAPVGSWNALQAAARTWNEIEALAAWAAIETVDAFT